MNILLGLKQVAGHLQSSLFNAIAFYIKCTQTALDKMLGQQKTVLWHTVHVCTLELGNRPERVNKLVSDTVR